MDVLIVEPLEPEVMQWLGERHAVHDVGDRPRWRRRRVEGLSLRRGGNRD